MGLLDEIVARKRVDVAARRARAPARRARGARRDALHTAEPRRGTDAARGWRGAGPRRAQARVPRQGRPRRGIRPRRPGAGVRAGGRGGALRPDGPPLPGKSRRSGHGPGPRGLPGAREGLRRRRVPAVGGAGARRRRHPAHRGDPRAGRGSPTSSRRPRGSGSRRWWRSIARRSSIGPPSSAPG